LGRDIRGMQEILDKLSNGVIGGPDDLMGIGECLNLLEELEASSELTPQHLENLNQLKKLFNRIVLEESKDVENDWRTVRYLMSEICGEEHEEGEGFSAALLPQVNADWQAIEKLMDEVCEEKPGKDAVTASLSPSSLCTPSLADADEMDEGWDTGASAPVEEEEPSESVELQDPELLKDFLEEAKEHLSSIELNILSLEENPGDQEAINAIFRPFHSIKGVAGFLNLKDIHYLTHEVENILDEARSNKLEVTDDVIDLILKSLDILKVLLGDLENSLSQGSVLSSSSPVVAAFTERLRSFQKKGYVESPAVGVRKIGEILVDRGVVDTEVIEKVAVDSKSKGKKLGEELITEGVVSTREVSSALREQRVAKENAASVRIDTHKLDNLVDMVGELVIAQSMVLQNPEVLDIKDQKFQKDSVQLRRITNELQRISMSMRMVPIKATFQKLIRLVRDLSKKSGKDVVLEMKGEETEIDRNMVEEIYEPLVHMIRNGIDHGIESPEERKQVGKNPRGTVLLSAEQKGGYIGIDIEDDGKGLDSEKIRATAIQRGVISPEEQLDERAVYDLIFHPGFSTNEKITEISGRGVGMDVVKQSVERLRGKVEISSVRGKGTHFQLKLPLTMAIIDGMIINVGNERYVVPTIALKESFRPSRNAYMTVHNKGETIKVRNTLMPLIRLHQMFGVEPRSRDPWDSLLLVVSEDNRSYCLLADEIVGRQEVVIKSLGSSLRNVVGISGGAILGDGRVALIIDVKGVVSHYEGNMK